MRRLFSPSHLSAGFIAVLVGYTSSAAIVFQAASAAGGSAADIGSWLWALGIGMFATSVGLSATSAVVTSIVMIVVIDGIFTVLLS